jgi:hypothetical protein
MLIRMTFIGTPIAAVLAAGAVATGSLFGAGSHEQGRHTALVIDAALARDGRELVDPRLKDLDADVRLPRNSTEARTNVRYFDALGYRVVVAGSEASAAADVAGVDAVHTQDLPGALKAAN